MPAREDVTPVARPAMGATDCVWAAHNASPIGLLKPIVAMRGGRLGRAGEILLGRSDEPVSDGR